MNRFTDTELQTVYSAAKSSVAIEVWLAKFNASTPDTDGTSVDTTDTNTIGGIMALEAVGILAVGRANEILGIAGSPIEVALGKFRVLPPFYESFPGEYNVLQVIDNGAGPQTYVLDQDAGGFSTTYLEAV
jgi:hypothetical protein